MSIQGLRDFYRGHSGRDVEGVPCRVGYALIRDGGTGSWSVLVYRH